MYRVHPDLRLLVRGSTGEAGTLRKLLQQGWRRSAQKARYASCYEGQTKWTSLTNIFEFACRTSTGGELIQVSLLLSRLHPEPWCRGAFDTGTAMSHAEQPRDIM